MGEKAYQKKKRVSGSENNNFRPAQQGGGEGEGDYVTKIGGEKHEGPCGGEAAREKRRVVPTKKKGPWSAQSWRGNGQKGWGCTEEGVGGQPLRVTEGQVGTDARRGGDGGKSVSREESRPATRL